MRKWSHSQSMFFVSCTCVDAAIEAESHVSVQERQPRSRTTRRRLPPIHPRARDGRQRPPCSWLRRTGSVSPPCIDGSSERRTASWRRTTNEEGRRARWTPPTTSVLRILTVVKPTISRTEGQRRAGHCRYQGHPNDPPR